MRPELRKLRFPKTQPLKIWSDVSNVDWNSYKWQMQSRLNNPLDLAKVFAITDSEMLKRTDQKFHIGITPYYASLIKSNKDSLGLQALPHSEELIVSADEYLDPLAEEDQSPVRGLVHRYPDRVLMYATHFCAMYCRFCTRSRKVSDPTSAQSTKDFEAMYEYIENNPKIRDIVISGGDPLTLSDEKIGSVLERLTAINHVEIIRLGTRAPVTIPQRITPELIDVLKQYSPLYVNTHFNHPAECTQESYEASQLLLNAGCILSNQMVLLRNVNDSIETVIQLNHNLLLMGIRPYYIYQCDKNEGNRHFRVPISKGLQIIEGLIGYTSGLAVPHFVKDIECGGGKIHFPDGIIKREANTYTLRNYQGKIFTYEDVPDY